MSLTIGERYPRPVLLQHLGGGGRSTGVIYTPGRPGVVFCTSGGTFADVAGFRDGPIGDGTWRYSGQQGGAKGPENTVGNRRIRESRIILLFTQRDGSLYQYEGPFHVREEVVIEQGERAAGTAEWEIVGKRLLFTFEPCDHRCPAYAELQWDNVVA